VILLRKKGVKKTGNPLESIILVANPPGGGKNPRGSMGKGMVLEQKESHTISPTQTRRGWIRASPHLGEGRLKKEPKAALF